MILKATKQSTDRAATSGEAPSSTGGRTGLEMGAEAEKQKGMRVTVTRDHAEVPDVFMVRKTEDLQSRKTPKKNPRI